MIPESYQTECSIWLISTFSTFWINQKRRLCPTFPYSVFTPAWCSNFSKLSDSCVKIQIHFSLFESFVRVSNFRGFSLKSTSVSVCFWGISRLPSAFVFLRWFKLAHMSIQVCTFHDGCKQGIDQQIFNKKSISRKITHPQSWKLQAKLAGERLKGWSNSREKTNSRLQSKSRNTS